MHLGAAIIAALSLTGYAFPRQRPGYVRMLPRANDTEISCGQTEYTLTEVRSAADAACQHVEDGTTAGSSSYPHTYRNQEGFDFNGVEGPFVEFPMKTSGVYKGGKRFGGNGICRFAWVVMRSAIRAWVLVQAISRSSPSRISGRAGRSPPPRDAALSP